MNLRFLSQRSRSQWHLSLRGHTCFTNISCFNWIWYSIMCNILLSRYYHWKCVKYNSGMGATRNIEGVMGSAWGSRPKRSKTIILTIYTTYTIGSEPISFKLFLAHLRTSWWAIVRVFKHISTASLVKPQDRSIWYVVGMFLV